MYTYMYVDVYFNTNIMHLPDEQDQGAYGPRLGPSHGPCPYDGHRQSIGSKNAKSKRI